MIKIGSEIQKQDSNSCRNFTSSQPGDGSSPDFDSFLINAINHLKQSPNKNDISRQHLSFAKSPCALLAELSVNPIK
jgi:hypothetical protein